MIFTFDIPIYYEDTDAGGIVYYANYLRFAERARTEFLHTLGLTNKEMLEQGFAIVVRRVEIDYKSPAQLEDVISVSSSLLELGAASMVMRQTMTRNDRELVNLKVYLAFIDVKALRPVRMPDALKEKLKPYLGEETCSRK